MKKVLSGAVLAVLVALSACNSNPRTQNQENDTVSEYIDTEHTSQNSLDWQGTYEGTIPCADCPGIKTIVTLKDNGIFAHSAEYLERDLIAADSGSFVWHDNGNVVHLKGENTDVQYQVGENQLFQLDQEGQRITGELAENYILKKIR